MMELADFYQYSRLTGKDAIRLIYLEPSGDLESAIQCSLKDARLTEYRDDIADHYSAISYVWGDANDKRSITVDGKRLDITASLESALRHIRDSRRVLRIWADGVCINQTNVEDRNQQVGLMGQIYSIALHTVIFLGPSSPQCDSVLKLMKSKDQPSWESTGSGGTFTREELVSQFEVIVENEILSRPWFTRVWILQELVLSKDPWIQCGRSRIRWDAFCRNVISTNSSSWKRGRCLVLRNMNETRINFATTNDSETVPGVALLEVLCRRRGCALSDPRDMIYAHLGLASAMTRDSIVIDYSKTVAQVYEDIAWLYMEWTSADIVLSLVEYVQPEERRGYQASWVPDWSSLHQPDNPIHVFTPKDISERPKGHEKHLSRVVPQVIAFPTRGYITIDAIIPESSWPKIHTNPWRHKQLKLPSSLTITTIMLWLSRSDDEFTRTKQLLIDSTARIITLTENNREPTEPIWSDGEQSAWAGVASIVSTWVPARKSNIKSLFLPPAQKKEETQKFTKLCIQHMMQLASCYSQFRHVASFQGGGLAQVPSLSRKGDRLVQFSTWLFGSAYAIVRPYEVRLDGKEQKLVRKDLNCHDRTIIENCRFVADASDIWQTGTDRYSPIRRRGREEGFPDPFEGQAPYEQRIFALH